MVYFRLFRHSSTYKGEFMHRKTTTRKAFTLSEVAMVLAILGVIAALGVGVLRYMNVSQFPTLKAAFKNDFATSLATMNLDQSLADIKNTADLVAKAQEYYDFSNVKPFDEAFSDSYKDAAGNDVNFPNYDYTFVTESGASVSLSYVPNNGINLNNFAADSSTIDGVNGSYEISNKTLNFVTGVYDVNGPAGPNKIGEDVGIIMPSFTLAKDDTHDEYLTIENGAVVIKDKKNPDKDTVIVDAAGVFQRDVKSTTDTDPDCPPGQVDDEVGTCVCALNAAKCESFGLNFNKELCSCEENTSCAADQILENGVCFCKNRNMQCGNHSVNSFTGEHDNCTCRCELGASLRCQSNGGKWDSETCNCDCSPVANKYTITEPGAASYDSYCHWECTKPLEEYTIKDVPDGDPVIEYVKDPAQFTKTEGDVKYTCTAAREKRQYYVDVIVSPAGLDKGCYTKKETNRHYAVIEKVSDEVCVASDCANTDEQAACAAEGANWAGAPTCKCNYDGVCTTTMRNQCTQAGGTIVAYGQGDNGGCCKYPEDKKCEITNCGDGTNIIYIENSDTLKKDDKIGGCGLSNDDIKAKVKKCTYMKLVSAAEGQRLDQLGHYSLAAYNEYLTKDTSAAKEDPGCQCRAINGIKRSPCVIGEVQKNKKGQITGYKYNNQVWKGDASNCHREVNNTTTTKISNANGGTYRTKGEICTYTYKETNTAYQPGIVTNGLNSGVVEVKYTSSCREVNYTWDPILLIIPQNGNPASGQGTPAMKDGTITADLTSEIRGESVTWLASQPTPTYFFLVKSSATGKPVWENYLFTDLSKGKTATGQDVGFKTGVDELKASYDKNNDGVVNELDSGFATLRLWADKNGNGSVDSGELFTLADKGVVEIATDYSLRSSYDGTIQQDDKSITALTGSFKAAIQPLVESNYSKVVQRVKATGTDGKEGIFFKIQNGTRTEYFAFDGSNYVLKFYEEAGKKVAVSAGANVKNALTGIPNSRIGQYVGEGTNRRVIQTYKIIDIMFRS